MVVNGKMNINGSMLEPCGAPDEETRNHYKKYIALSNTKRTLLISSYHRKCFSQSKIEDLVKIRWVRGNLKGL